MIYQNPLTFEFTNVLQSIGDLEEAEHLASPSAEGQDKKDEMYVFQCIYG